MKALKFLLSGNAILLVLAGILEILISPKWTVALAAWALPVVWIYLARRMSILYFALFAILIKYAAGLLAMNGIFPFPFQAFLIYMFVISAVSILPYMLDKWTFRKFPGFAQTLILPSAFTLLEYAISFSPAGTWGSIAYTQVNADVVVQLVSMTGIWGIIFLIYWVGSTLNYLISVPHARLINSAPIILLVVVLIFGFMRLQFSENSVRGLKIGSVTANQLRVAHVLYQNTYGQDIHIPPKINQSDPLMTVINQAYMNYLENPYDSIFAGLRNELETMRVDLYRKSERLVKDGAEVIVWSEAAVQGLKSEEKLIREEGSNFASANKVWFILPVAIFQSGHHKPGSTFLENKLLIFNDQGELIHEYFKNVPVKGIEPAFPGDGNIPVININGIEVAAIICYDADFPDLISQTGRKNAELLIVPSSDWYTIREAHAGMARFRAVENGTALYRPAGNGYTTVTDATGSMLMLADYFHDVSHTSLVHVPIQERNTLYSRFPQFIPDISLIILVVLAVIYSFKFLRKIRRKGE